MDINLELEMTKKINDILWENIDYKNFEEIEEKIENIIKTFV
jgi:hypothetical protein